MIRLCQRILFPGVIASGVLLAATAGYGATDFRRGDANADGAVDISDSLGTLFFLFADATAFALPCEDAGDVNDDGAHDLSDVIYGLSYLFTGGPAPLPPGPETCGLDPTADSLDCASYDAPGCVQGSPPARPTGLTVASGNAQVSLNWTDNAEPDLAGYNVYRSTTQGAGHAKVNGAPGGVSAYADAGLTNGTRYYYQVTAVDSDGAESPRSVEVSSKPTAGPPDPSDVAPPPPIGIVTNFADSVKFLYEGSGIQTDVTPGAIDEKRVAVLHGRLRAPAGEPVAMARVSVLGHPEFGQTLTRDDGKFDLAVNGGGTLTVEFSKEGFLTVQRQARATWNDWEGIEEVVMTALDPVVTTVTLAGATEMQVARGSPVTDAAGQRQATVLFPAGATAEMVLPDGTKQALSTLHVRATEYTIGATGPKAMPAPLPPSSGYTYCVELSVDEAIAAGASEVRFNEPVVFHVDNFIGFPVGDAVPLGWYDRKRGVWVPAPNGRVIAVLGVTGGLADLDTDGDNAVDDAPKLAALGVTDAERTTLASLYPNGGSLWRSRIPHFTPWDANWPWGPPPDSGPPPPFPPKPDPCDGSKKSGSIIGCEPQTLGEVLEITGTPFQLVYQSERAPQRHVERNVRIQLSGPADTMPELLPEEIIVRGAIAGQTFEERFPPEPNQAFDYVWNGLDKDGRTVWGTRTLNGEVSYRYIAQYYEGGPDEFEAAWDQAGRSSGAMVAGVRSGDSAMIEFKRPFEFLLGHGPEGDIGGWTLDVHHALDPASGMVFLGSGGRVTDEGSIESKAGAASGQPADGKPASHVAFEARRIATSPDGSTYLIHGFAPEVWRIGTDELYHLAVGCLGGACSFTIQDGASATKLRNFTVEDIDVGPDGLLYAIIDPDGASGPTLLRVEADGKILRLAGALSGTPPTQTPHGLVARDVKMNLSKVRCSPNGTVYVLEKTGTWTEQIYRLTADGTLVHVAGTRGGTCAVDEAASHGLVARDLCYSGGVTDFDVDAEGNVYVIGQRSLTRVTPAGTFEHLAGTPSSGGDCALKKPLVSGAPLSRDACWYYFGPVGLQISDDGVPYVWFGDIGPSPDPFVGAQGIVRLDGAMNLVAGGGATNRAGVWPLAFSWITGPGKFAFDIRPDGQLALGAEVANRSLLVVVSPLFVGDAEGVGFMVPARDGRAAWIFDAKGRHLKTRDLLTGATFWSFGYDGEGRLASVTDGAGKVTTLSRTEDGSMIVITAPGGQATLIDANANGWATRIENPAGEAVTMTYKGSGGLLESTTDPRGNTAQFTWDPLGRLTSETSALGDTMTLTPSEVENGRQVVFIRGGRTTTYRSVVEDDGTTTRTIVGHDGEQSLVRTKPDGSKTFSSSGGTNVKIQTSPDPRFGSLLPFTSFIEVKKGDRTYTGTVERSVSGGLGYFGSGTLTQNWTVNGQTTTMELDAATKTLRLASAAGRSREVTFDALGRATTVSFGPGAATATTTWGPTGLLDHASFGAFSRDFEYDAKRRLVEITDDAGRVYGATYDDDDRPLTFTDAAGRKAEFSWHPDGSLASFKQGGGQPHLVDSTVHGELASYKPPGNPVAYTRTFSPDGRLESQKLPSGRTVAIEYDAAGFLTGLAYPEAALTFTPLGTTDRPALIAREPQSGVAQTLAYTWEGTLPTKIVLSGAAEGVIDTVYGNDFLPTSSTLTSGGESVARALAWDADGRVMAHGPVAFTRGGVDRAVSEVKVGGATFAIGWTPEGLPAGRSLSLGGTQRYAVTLAYDAGAMLTARTETVGGTTQAFVYTHALDGRITKVARNGAEIEAYGYDTRGNRTSASYDGGAAVTAVYDAQDRILSHGATVYTVNVDGYLAARGADAFSYSSTGEILSATVGGATVTYDYDGLRRLVRRNGPDGATVFFYADPFDMFRPSAYRAPGEVLTSLHYDDQGLLVAFARGGGVWIVATDQVGSPRVVIDDATGATVKTIVYDTYGRVLSDSNPSLNLPIGFAGGIQDPVTGLVHFGMRDYEPIAGRWTARDPAFLEGGQFNLYEYVGSDPARYRDPLGLWCAGASAYAGLGGGAKTCCTWKGCSVCGELGVGLGESFDLSPMAGLDDSFLGFEAGLKANVGNIISAGCEGSVGVDPDGFGDSDPCTGRRKWDGDCKAGAFGFEASPFKGLPTATWDPNGSRQALKRPDKLFQLQGKATAKVCAKF